MAFHFHDYKPGDVVRFRQWDDMVAEHGLNSDDEIRTAYTFTKEMRELCGQEMVVSDVEDFLTRPDVQDIHFEPNPMGRDYYWYSSDMFELINGFESTDESDKPITITDDDLSLILG